MSTPESVTQEAEPRTDAPNGEEQRQTPEAKAETAAAQGTANEEKDESLTKPNKGDGGWQRRIDKLTRRNYELQAKLDAAHSVKSETAAKPTTDPEPTPDKFETYELFVKAQARWEARQELKSQREAEVKEARDAEMREAYTTYNAKVDEAESRYDDFDEVVNNKDIKISTAMQVAIIEGVDNGPDVAYYLGKNPERCEQIAQMSDTRAIAAISKISLELAGGVKPSPEHRPASNASAPIKPVGGSTTKSTVPLDQLPYPEYKKAREAQLKANGRR